MTDATTHKSKFALFFQNDATPENNKPSLKGNLTLPTGETYNATLWAGEPKDGKGMYLTGQVQPQDITAALAANLRPASDHNPATGEVKVGIMPVGLELQQSQIALFQTAAEALTQNPKRPTFYGYVHTPEGIFRVAAWNRTTKSGAPMLAGNVEPNVPRPASDTQQTPEPTTPRPNAKTKALRAGQGTA